MWGSLRPITILALVLVPLVTGQYPHPLDPLTEDEINLVTSIILNFAPNPALSFHYITLQEPPKSLLLPYFLRNENPPPGSIPRKAFAMLVDNRANVHHNYEAIVNLDQRQVELFNPIQDDHDPFPFTTLEQILDAEEIALSNPEVIRRTLNLGYTNMSLITGDPWPMGTINDRPEYLGKKLVMVFLFAKSFEGENEYGNPFDFAAIVDMEDREVFEVMNIEDLPTHEDFDAGNKEGNYKNPTAPQFNPDVLPADFYRKDLKPVKVSQPEGVSWKVEGNEVTWQNFKFRVGFNGREGLVLHQVSFNDSGEVRPLFYRISVSEMFVPYGDPRSPYHRKHVFDEGQYGLGFESYELRPQVDCVGTVHFFDGFFNDEEGHGERLPRRVCMSEEDHGLLWKHTDTRTGQAVAVRDQRLTLTHTVTVSNYDYNLNWHFALDGTIEFKARATGILSVHLLALNNTPAGTGTEVHQQLNAAYHQHYLGLRIDPEIDGSENTVVMVDAVPLEQGTNSTENPYGVGWTTRTTPLTTVGNARTNIDPVTARTWHMRNEERLHPGTKRPVGYKLIAPASPPYLAKVDSPVRRNVGFLDYNTWVTRYNDDEMFPAGFYLNGTGLPEWVARDENANIEQEDVVLWHHFGISHVPRAEDFPIMPQEEFKVTLKPHNFFAYNPSLDVPPAEEEGERRNRLNCEKRRSRKTETCQR